MENSLSPKSFYCVYNDYDIDSYTKELNLLYLPLIGSDAVKLYCFLGSKMLGGQNLSKSYLHYDILDNLALEVAKFVLARKKLEALGLLKSYYLDNQYVYKVQRVLSFSEFFNTPILAQLLENTIGVSEYNELKSYYMNDKVSFSNFDDITASFSDIYRLENMSDVYVDFSEGKLKGGPNFDEYTFDFAKLNYHLASSYLSDIVANDDVKKDILGLAHLYKTTPQDMAKAVENSVEVVDGKNILSLDKMKEYLLQLYVNVRKQDVPVLDKMISKKLLDEDKEELTEEDLFIREVDNTNYITYLNKQMNIILSNVDARAVEQLQSKYNFPTGVLNILLDYAITRSSGNGFPPVNYVDKIASSWKAENLLGARDAIDYARKMKGLEKSRTTSSTKKATRRVSSGTFQNKKLYTAPYPEYMKERMKGLSGTKNKTQRTVTKEDDEAFNEMLKELNKKR